MKEECCLFIVMKKIGTDEFYQFLVEDFEDNVLSFHNKEKNSASAAIHRKITETAYEFELNPSSLEIFNYVAFNKKDLKCSMRG